MDIPPDLGSGNCEFEPHRADSVAPGWVLLQR